MKYFKLIILFIFIATAAIFSQTKYTEKRNIYVVVDANSPNVYYWKKILEKSNVNSKKDVYTLFYILKSYGKNNPNPITVQFSRRNPEYNFSELENFRGIDFHNKRMPIQFIDSVETYDEEYIINGRDELYRELNTNNVYLLDKATIKNDSITMFRVVVGYTGFPE